MSVWNVKYCRVAAKLHCSHKPINSASTVRSTSPGRYSESFRMIPKRDRSPGWFSPFRCSEQSKVSAQTSALNTSDRRVFGGGNQLPGLYFQPHGTDLAAAFRRWLLIENCSHCSCDVLVQRLLGNLFFPSKEAEDFTQIKQ